ncbi:DUF5916 domain-containing protein [Luteimonas salinilitoris]|uniref:DUF5916 domain-containing protein n=1 Tax=Luteimonas salinilitoris TaxID=3237697 RepID=A0ABV4HNU4_9GAMM
MRLPLAHLCALAFAWPGIANAATITVDGRLDEPEWATAQRFTDFRVTQPYTRGTPRLRTEARLLSTPEGIAVAFINQQPPGVPRVKPRIERDQRRASDRVNFIIDFDADGKIAYDFAVLLSGSIQDDIVTDETEFNPDWNPDWSWAVDEDEHGWCVELLIPWTVTAMRDSQAPTRTVAVYFDRVLGSNAERQAFPVASSERARFVSKFHHIEIPQYRRSLFHVFPYITAQHDFIRDRRDYKAGADLFWKPSAGFQLSATFNPDFGQVEADELVVNFDAIEEFQSDKRPFFTENQGFFDLRTPEDGFLIYTRRIGGESDDDSGLAADIDAALKLNGSIGSLGYGLLVAEEAGDAGRSFYATRLFRPLSETLSLGWLGTRVERPALDRQADVQAIDLFWQLHEDLSINAQILASFIKEHVIEEQGGRSNGDGAWLTASWSPSDRWEYELEALHFGRNFDFNDFGFQERNSLNHLQLSGEYEHEVNNEDSMLRSTSWGAEVEVRTNDSGRRLPGALALTQSNSFRSGAELEFEIEWESAGVDDLISRGNGDWNQPARRNLFVSYRRPVRGAWQIGGEVEIFQEGLSGYTFEGELVVNWFPRDDFNLELSAGPVYGRDWLVWGGEIDEDGDELGFRRYRQRTYSVDLDANWFPGRRHELRLKAQWLAIATRDGQAYVLDDGELQATGEPVPDFSANGFGVQLRYRYQLGVQSDFYLVYSRGGELELERASLRSSDLLEEALELRDADQLLAKIRYRF